MKNNKIEKALFGTVAKLLRRLYNGFKNKPVYKRIPISELEIKLQFPTRAEEYGQAVDQAIINGNQEIEWDYFDGRGLLSDPDSKLYVPVKVSDLGLGGQYLNFLNTYFSLNPTYEMYLGRPFQFPTYKSETGRFSGVGGSARTLPGDRVEVLINTRIPYTYLPSLITHEIGSHGTDNSVIYKPITDFTLMDPPEITRGTVTEFLRRSPFKSPFSPIYPTTVNLVYLRIADIQSSVPKRIKKGINDPAANIIETLRMKNTSESSKRWYEARALLNEYRLKHLAALNYDKYDFDKEVDALDPDLFLQELSEHSIYGEDYKRRYETATDKEREIFINLCKYALKYLPSVTLATPLFTDNELK